MTRTGKLFELDITSVSNEVEPKAQANLEPDQHCTEMLIYRHDQKSLLLCNLTAQKYLIYSLTDFSCKSIWIDSNPIKDLAQYQNFIIASKTAGEGTEAGTSLCRIRPVEDDPHYLFMERSKITGCHAILQHKKETSQFFGFNAEKQAFVIFKLEALRPFQMDCEVYEIVVNLQYVKFANNFDFSKLIPALNHDQVINLSPKILFVGDVLAQDGDQNFQSVETITLDYETAWTKLPEGQQPQDLEIDTQRLKAERKTVYTVVDGRLFAYRMGRLIDSDEDHLFAYELADQPVVRMETQRVQECLFEYDKQRHHCPNIDLSTVKAQGNIWHFEETTFYKDRHHHLWFTSVFRHWIDGEQTQKDSLKCWSEKKANFAAKEAEYLAEVEAARRAEAERQEAARLAAEAAQATPQEVNQPQ